MSDLDFAVFVGFAFGVDSCRFGSSFPGISFENAANVGHYILGGPFDGFFYSKNALRAIKRHFIGRLGILMLIVVVVVGCHVTMAAAHPMVHALRGARHTSAGPSTRLGNYPKHEYKCNARS